MDRLITVLGATGSVGRATLDVVAAAQAARAEPRLAIDALTAGSNVADLVALARTHGARLAVIAEDRLYPDLRDGLFGTGIKPAAGAEALVEAAARPSAFVMAAIVGAAGLPPVLAAVRRGAAIGLANKEALVCAGPLIKREAWRFGARLIPVDSEHSAIFQAMTHPDRVDRLTLTASGGPFRTRPLETLAEVTPAEACRHPVWAMGAKISVDSATMMNKGLELIEAAYLFDVAESRIDVLIHPESIVHSLVSFIDGSVLAQLGSPDMKTPIACALAWPDRMAAPVERLNLATVGRLHFEAPDPQRFPALGLARRALAVAGAPTVLNAANEVAVAAFLAGKIRFPQITDCAASVLADYETAAHAPHRVAGTLAEVLELDAEARRWAGRWLDAQASVS
jgi:1-deoxy-D-xylulose-5-phosphate reductoisomerase